MHHAHPTVLRCVFLSFFVSSFFFFFLYRIFSFLFNPSPLVFRSVERLLPLALSSLSSLLRLVLSLPESFSLFSLRNLSLFPLTGISREEGSTDRLVSPSCTTLKPCPPSLSLCACLSVPFLCACLSAFVSLSLLLFICHFLCLPLSVCLSCPLLFVSLSAVISSLSPVLSFSTSLVPPPPSWRVCVQASGWATMPPGVRLAATSHRLETGQGQAVSARTVRCAQKEETQRRLSDGDEHTGSD